MILWRCFFVIWMLLVHHAAPAQKAFEVQLNIDMAGIDTSIVDGTFALHARFTKYPYSSSFTDTLLEEIPLRPTQWLSIPAATLHIAGHYLQFTPNDRSLSPKKWFFQYHHPQKDTIVMQLNCYFFNQAPPVLFTQMQERDTLTFFSKYSGNTHEMMLIPSYSLQIVKHGQYYQAFYTETSAYAHQIGTTNTMASDSLVLTKKHLIIIQNFEANLWRKVHFDEDTGGHFLPNYSVIALRRQRRAFRASGQMGYELWQQLLAAN